MGIIIGQVKQYRSITTYIELNFKGLLKGRWCKAGNCIDDFFLKLPDIYMFIKGLSF